MAILAYGINYRTAPVALRERIAFPEDALDSYLNGLRGNVPSLQEAAILSTCNRTELYCTLDPREENRLVAWITGNREVGIDELTSAAYRHWDADAAKHLIRVASGLDSQVLGEPQIMGQVKTAYDIARSAGTVGPSLNLLSQVSLNTAKRVRTDTGIGRNPVSVAYAAVLLSKQIFSSLDTKHALLLGAGDTIGLVAEHLGKQGIGSMTIANRTLKNAELLAAEHRAAAMQLTDVPSRLAEFDIVISSTGSSLPVIGKGAVEAAVRQRKRRPMFMVDIAVPRDIEPEVGELPDVFLYSIDDLSEIVEENARAREAAAEEANALVDEGAQHYLRELRVHEGQAVLRSFRDKASEVQRRELAKAQALLADGGDADEALAQLARSLTNKLIHEPTVAIRNASAEGQADVLDVLKKLYDL